MGLEWTSVEIPRLPPKPNLMPLTGGYRLTPTLQIGADVYCDTKCILAELENRFPNPEMFPPLAWAFGAWTDGPMFKDALGVALVEMAPNMPPEFFADRLQLYFGEGVALEDLQGAYKESKARVRVQLGWMEAQLQKTHAYMMGSSPSMADALAYYLVWFLRTRLPEDTPFFTPFENLERWEREIKAIGHGTVSTLSDLEALEVAKNAEPETKPRENPDDAQGFKVGDVLGVAPATGGPEVIGAAHHISANRIALLRKDETVGNVCTHFPRLGYTVRQT